MSLDARPTGRYDVIDNGNDNIGQVTGQGHDQASRRRGGGIDADGFARGERAPGRISRHPTQSAVRDRPDGVQAERAGTQPDPTTQLYLGSCHGRIEICWPIPNIERDHQHG